MHVAVQKQQAEAQDDAVDRDTTAETEDVAR